jgi:mRNA interferase RelE/StbE
LLTATARRMLAEITDRRIKEQISKRIEALTGEPEKLGKPLLGELSGYRSLRAAGQRFRVIYKIEKKQVIIIVVALGIRKEGDKRDIYALAQKLVKLGLLG